MSICILFKFGPIINSASRKEHFNEYCTFGEHICIFLLDIYLQVELLDLRGR